MDETQSEDWFDKKAEETEEDWLNEEEEEDELNWTESLLDFADGWPEDEESGFYDEELEQALAEEQNTVLESELEQDENPLDAEDYTPEDPDTPDAPISLSTLRQQIEETAVERLGKAARTEADFTVVIGEMDRLDRNRERRERYHENLRGDVPLEYKKANYGLIFPEWLNTPEQQLLNKGSFLDLIFDCPYEMHNLTADPFLSKIIQELNVDHKEVLYFLSLRLYSTTRLAQLRGQSDRNIRKLRDTYTRKLQKKLYAHLIQKPSLTLREQEFVTLYAASLEANGKKSAKVRRENKTPPRKKSGLTDGSN